MNGEISKENKIISISLYRIVFKIVLTLVAVSENYIEISHFIAQVHGIVLRGTNSTISWR